MQEIAPLQTINRSIYALGFQIIVQKEFKEITLGTGAQA